MKPVVGLENILFCWLKILAIGILAASSGVVMAQSTGETTSLRVRTTKKIEKTYANLSNGILATSLRLDSILGHDESDDEIPNSHIRIKMKSMQDRVHGQKFKNHINTKLSLPRTEKRLHLFVSNFETELRDEDIITTEDFGGETEQSSESSQEGESFVAGLRHMLLASDTLHFHVDTGVKVAVPVDLFLRLKARQSFQYKAFATNFFQHAFAYQHDGYGYDLGVSFDRPLGFDFHLRQTNIIIFRDIYESRKLQHGLSLIQPLGKRRVITYFISATGLERPALHVTDYNVGVTYRTPVGWPWAIFEVTPMVNYSRPENFASNLGINFQFEVTFGAI